MPPELPISTRRLEQTPSASFLLGQENTVTPAGSSEHEEHAPSRAIPQRIDGSPSRHSFSSSLNQKTPARSFYHRSVRDSSCERVEMYKL